QLQRSPACRCPSPGDDAAGNIDRTKTATVHPLGKPRPSVRTHETCELLVAEQRRDDRMVDLAEFPLTGRLDVHPDPVQCPQQLRMTIEMQLRITEMEAHGIGELGHPRGQSS